MASLDPKIPYVLLGFGPSFLLPDLPPTSVSHTEEAVAAARGAGLRRVHAGNRQLLTREYGVRPTSGNRVRPAGCL